MRLPELITDRGLTAYSVAQKSGKRIDSSTLYRLMRQEGRVKYFAADLCQALVDVLKIAPNELFESQPQSDARPARRSRPPDRDTPKRR